MRVRLLIGIISLLPLPALQAQDMNSVSLPEKLSFNHISVENGLVNNTVTCFEKDSRGFLWIGTTNGLSKYDGYEFTNYFHVPEDSTSISGNQISSILSDSKGRLWISTMRDGFNLYHPEKDEFEQIKTEGAFSLNQIRKIFEDSRGRIFLASLGAGFMVYDQATRKLSVYDTITLGGLYSNFVSDIIETSDGHI